MPNSFTPYETRSAVLFVIFNRPDTTEKVFEQIRAAKPPRLYVAADAPRTDSPGEDELCRETKQIVSKVDWPCEVKTFFRKKNVGCKENVSSAITWFFSHEEEGIILEDDCLPASSFFRFCDEMLEKYRNDTRIRHITGCNLQHGKKWGEGSYYFANRTHVWGWAGWRRVWKDYDKNLSRYSKSEVHDQLNNIFDDPLVVTCWEEIFEQVKAGEINAWGYQLDFANFFNNGLTIIPNENLISNIGFGGNATNTMDSNNPHANIPLAEIEEITHPVYILPQKQADLITLNTDFKLDEKRRQNLPRKRLKRWARSMMKQAAAYLYLLT